MTCSCRPWIRAMVNPAVASALRAAHPLRLQRSLHVLGQPDDLGSFRTMADAAAGPSAARPRPTTPSAGPSASGADLLEQWLDMGRDIRDAGYESAFFTCSGAGRWRSAFGRGATRPDRSLKTSDELRSLPQVQTALMHIRAAALPRR